MSYNYANSELEALDFKVERAHEHDGFVTQVRRNGVMKVETTWHGQTFKTESQEFSIENDTFVKGISKNELIFLNQIFNK